MRRPCLLRPRIAGLVLLIASASCGGPEEELAPTSESYELTAAVEQWRKLVEKYFKYQNVTWGLNIIKCESGGNPNAYNSSSGASGLFQHLAKYWPPRATAAGFPGASPFNPEANIAASANLFKASGASPWSCKYSPVDDFNYQPQFYKNGVAIPTTCKASCSGAKITATDCSVSTCASSCVDDALGVRCVSASCPAQGQKKVCVGDKLGSCTNGSLSTSTCPTGQKCVDSASGASCATPSTPTPTPTPTPATDSKASTPASDGGVSPDPEPVPAQDGGGASIEPPVAEAAGPYRIVGGCHVGAGASGGALLPLLLLPLLVLRRQRRSR
jgi:hypothetical protein